MINFLNNKKTYLVAIAGGVVFVCTLLGYIPQEIANQIYIALGITGTVTVRSAIAKSQRGR